MGNFITDTLGKMAANVTQSVISALIVTAVTTYLIISPGKKDDQKDASGKDSANTSTAVAPGEKPGVTGEGARAVQQPTDTSTPENVDAGKSMNTAGGTTSVAVPTAEKKTPPSRTEPPVNEAATKAYKEMPPETSAEQKLERTIKEARTKGDSLAQGHPQENKTKEIKKEEKKETKDVKKRADEVFDELDQDIQK